MCITGKILKLIASAVSNLGKSMCAVPSICTRSLWVGIHKIFNFFFAQSSELANAQSMGAQVLEAIYWSEMACRLLIQPSNQA